MTTARRLIFESKSERRTDQFSLALRPETGAPVIIHDYVVGTTRGEQWLGVPEFLMAHRGPPADALLTLIASLVTDEHATANALPWPKPGGD
jgi:hypothetical protein